MGGGDSDFNFFCDLLVPSLPICALKNPAAPFKYQIYPSAPSKTQLRPFSTIPTHLRLRKPSCALLAPSRSLSPLQKHSASKQAKRSAIPSSCLISMSATCLVMSNMSSCHAMSSCHVIMLETDPCVCPCQYSPTHVKDQNPCLCVQCPFQRSRPYSCSVHI